MPKRVSFDHRKMAHDLREAHPVEIIRWGVEQLGASSIAFACSFGYEDVALVNMVLEVDPDIDIFYLDTDLLFSETYQVRDRIKNKYQCNFLKVRPELTLDQQNQMYGSELWKRNPNQCCSLRKVTPLRKVLANYQGWITGIRREQSNTRAQTEVIEWDRSFDLWKLNPLAYWKEEQVWDYIRQYQIPYNPLHDKNYPSIGCFPCTMPVQPGEDPRSGRWAGFAKTECGLHNTEKKKVSK